MTEPEVASSDATNMQATATLDGEEVVVSGRKWWSTGIGHPRCEVIIFMGLTDPDADRYHQHSMVLVPLDTPGVKVERMLSTMGFLDAPGGHGEVSFTDVRLPASAIIGGLGQAFAIAQARLGPGRVHHCMRLIGLAELALELACNRAPERVAFGKPLANLGGNRERDRRRADRDRSGAAAGAARGLADRQAVPRCARGGVADQGGCTEHGAGGRGHADATAWRRRSLRRPTAGSRLDYGPRATAGRRPRRGAPRRDRPFGAGPPRPRQVVGLTPGHPESSWVMCKENATADLRRRHALPFA